MERANCGCARRTHIRSGLKCLNVEAEYVPSLDPLSANVRPNRLAHNSTFIARYSLNVDKALLVRYSGFSCTTPRDKSKHTSDFLLGEVYAEICMDILSVTYRLLEPLR